jgi:alpha-L-glutamate ligase-like protein
MFKFDFHKGVLGLNARNILYIRELNSRESISFADSKLKTKHYLSARSIPVPKLYAAIKTHDDLNKFDFGSLPGSVVLKPNKGSGGDGIIAFKERKGDTFYTVGGRALTTDEIKAHIIDIIDGRFSIVNTKDIAFFEQRIHTDSQLAKYTYQGLPDIRIIVYNLIPVMAMLRLPTKESEVRANMAQGALGVGIDIGTGKPTYIARKFKLIEEIPGVGKFDPKFKIPHWDQILLIASKCQQITNLGYLACDIAIDEQSGPILLELNARAGLKVQIANKAPLRKRLEQIKDIKVNTPEKGVRLAKDLFTSKDLKISNSKTDKKIISTEEQVQLFSNNKKYTLKAQIDILKDDAEISKSTLSKLNIDSDLAKIKVKLNLKDEKIITICKVNPKLKNVDIVLGKKEVQNFLIKPSSIKPKLKLEVTNTKSQNTDFFVIPQIDYGQVDYKISQVHSKIKFLSRIKPINFNEELNKYKADNSYNPQFLYKSYAELLLASYQAINELKTDDTPLGIIFEKKKLELLNYLKVIEYLGTSSITKHAKKIFPHPKKNEVENAKMYFNNIKYYQQLRTNKYLNAKEVADKFREVLSKYKLSNWSIEISKNIVADCSVNKSNKIFIKESGKFQEHRVKKLIAHEIETHILTAENGKKQPYQIFQNGTANYLETQEGLAIYNQELALHIYPHNFFSANTFLNCHIALNNSFSDAVEKLRRRGIERNLAITAVAKTKRGLSDTSEKGGIAKQLIYHRGALKIDKFVKSGGNLEDLYIGKISVDDIETFKGIKSLNKPSILPNWY